MPFVEWNESLSVGVPLFDSQHKELVNMINTLYDAMRRGEGKTVLADIFTSLVNYTAMHFKAEEDKMQGAAYPELAVHKEEHRKLVEQAKELEAQFRNGSLMISIEVMSFLKEWLAHHILQTDKKYGPFFAQKGL